MHFPEQFIYPKQLRWQLVDLTLKVKFRYSNVSHQTILVH